MDNFGWIEIVVFYGVAIGFGLWQYFKMDRELKQAKREKAEAEERDEGSSD